MGVWESQIFGLIPGEWLHGISFTRMAIPGQTTLEFLLLVALIFLLFEWENPNDFRHPRFKAYIGHPYGDVL